MADKRDYYEVLGVDKNADEAALKKAYRVLAKSTTPIRIRVIKKQKQNLKRRQRRTAY